jgi:hypothetical protein
MDSEEALQPNKRFKYIPVAVPIPISEEPALAIIALTSAKSTFTNPGICNQLTKLASIYKF